MKKFSFLTFLFFCLSMCPTVSAQEDDARTLMFHEMRYTHQLHLSVGAGANFDLAKSSSNPASTLFGIRPTTAPALDVRLTHLFAPRFGWYADARLKFFESKNAHASWGEQVANVFFHALGIGYVHAAYSVGGVFRMEGDRWLCYPRIGIGQSYYGMNRDKREEIDGEECVVLESDGTAVCLNFGVSTQYRLTRHLSLMLDVAYQQPVTRADSYLWIQDEYDGQPQTYRSSTIGRELNVSLGVNVSFYLKRK